MPSSFPPTVFVPRAVENRPGYPYDPDNLITLFAEDYHALADELIAIENFIQLQAAGFMYVVANDFSLIEDATGDLITYS